MNLRDYLKNNRIITDGAMGTYYDLVSGRCDMAEEANITEPQVIKAIHKKYIEAGARLIRTNTFAVNSHIIESLNEVEELIHAAFTIAKEAVLECRDSGILGSDEKVYIAADLGPLTEAENTDVIQEYKKLVDIFLRENPEVFVFETLSECSFLGEITDYIAGKTDAYILAQFCFDRTGYTKSGLSLNSILKETGRLKHLDAYGLNCGMVSTHMYHFLREVSFAPDKSVSALPNSSYPDVLRGKVIYSKQSTYFVDMMDKIDELGIRILGGCCGTTPAHIKNLCDRLKGKPLSQKSEENIDAQGEDKKEVSNYITDCLKTGKKVIMVELDPPFDGDCKKVIEGAAYLKGKGTDIVTLSDSPLARARMDAALLATLVSTRTGMRVMPHIACRDRNKIALRGLVMGMHASGIRNLLIVTGDPVQDNTGVKSVYEFNSIKLMEFVDNVNTEMFSNDRMHFGGALNYHGVNVEAIASRMKKKMAEGAEYFLTQPVYAQSDIERLKELKEMTGAHIIAGIMPLVSRKNALFIKNEMPGINVPDEIVGKYREDMSRDEYERTAVEICSEIIEKLGSAADGYYFMTPFNRYPLIQKIIDRIV